MHTTISPSTSPLWLHCGADGGRDQLQVVRGVEHEAAHRLAREHRVDVGHVLRKAPARFGGADVGGQLRVDEGASGDARWLDPEDGSRAGLQMPNKKAAPFDWR
jgi:hypothetical protein